MPSHTIFNAPGGAIKSRFLLFIEDSYETKRTGKGCQKQRLPCPFGFIEISYQPPEGSTEKCMKSKLFPPLQPVPAASGSLLPLPPQPQP